MAKNMKPIQYGPEQPRDVSFAHFGPLNPGEQDKASLFTSMTVNVVAAIIICILGAAAKKQVEKHNLERVTFLAKKEPEPIKQKPKPPPPLPKTPEIAKLEPPKIKTPVRIETPPPPKPEIKMVQPLPNMPAAAPLKVTPPPAPVLIANITKAASVPNHDTHPSAVALGNPTNPIAPSTTAAPTKINLGNAGMSGMPPSNSGRGPASVSINMGSGAPNGQMGGTAHAPTAIAGLRNGVPGGTGTQPGRTAVAIVQNLAPPPPQQHSAPVAETRPPTVTAHPEAACTEEAKKLKIEGAVRLNVVFKTTGVIQVVSVAQSLGHGLDQAAEAAAQDIRFKPAIQNGQPVDFPTVVVSRFACSAGGM